MRFYFYIKINFLSNYIMDLSKFIYNDIGDNILDRLFKEGKEIKKWEVQPAIDMVCCRVMGKNLLATCHEKRIRFWNFDGKQEDW